jgi:hypothetical protein
VVVLLLVIRALMLPMKVMTTTMLVALNAQNARLKAGHFENNSHFV